MENMTLEEGPKATPMETAGLEGKRKRLEEEGVEGDRIWKKQKLIDELILDVLAECLDSVDEGDSTYLGDVEAEEDDGGKEKVEELLMNCLFG